MTGFVIARACIPGRRDDSLIVVRLAVLDNDVVRKRTARSLVEADALGRLRPRRRIPFLHVGRLRVARLDVGDELVEEELVDLCIELAVEAAGSRAADHRRQPDFRCEIEDLRYRVDLVEHHLLSPGRLAEHALLGLRVDDDVACERTHLAELAAPFRRLEPGVLALLIQCLPIRRRAFLRCRELRRRHAVPRIVVAVSRVLVPRVLDAFREDFRLREVFGIDLVDLSRIEALAEVFDNAVAADEQVLEEVAVCRAGERLDRIGAVAEHALLGESAAVDAASLDVSGADCEDIGDVVVVDECAAEVDRAVDDAEAGRVDRCIAILERDGARHAADAVMRMRVLAAEDDLRRDEIAVLVEHLEVMCDGHEMDLRRQQLVIRMIPPVGREDAELAALDDGLDLALNLCEVLRRSSRECVVVRFRHRRARCAERQLVGVECSDLQVGRRDRVSGECLDRADPVECMQVVEVNDVVLDRQRRCHDVADVVGVLRDLDAEGILDSAKGTQSVCARADAADALDVSPGVARVAVLHDELEAAPCRTGRDGVRDLARTFIDLHLNAQMAFNSCDWIYYYVFHLFTCSPFSSSLAASRFFFCTTLATPCAATPTAVTPAMAAPILSTSPIGWPNFGRRSLILPSSQKCAFEQPMHGAPDWIG